MKIDGMNRRLAGFLDLLAFQIIFMFPVMQLMSYSMKGDELRILYKISTYLFYVAFGLYYGKDVFFSGSVIKRAFGIKVVDARTNEEVSALRTVLRNATLIPFFPLEVIIAIFSPKRRLGDLIFNTKLINAESKVPIGESFKKIQTEQLLKTTYKPILIGIAIAFGVTAALQLTIAALK